MQYLNRIQPNLPSDQYNTYAIRRRPDTQIVAACQQVGCAQWRYGWEMYIDESTDLGKAQAHYIRTQSGRTFREYRSEAGLTVFRFEPGQRCFANHLTIAEQFTVHRGDFRGFKGTIRKHVNGSDWAEDFAEHQDKLSDRIKEG